MLGEILIGAIDVRLVAARRGNAALRLSHTIALGTPSAQRVLRRVRSIPPGRVSTYADLSPGAPRFAGAVLSACGDPCVPWHRVVRADGSLAKGARQRALLDAEGVPFKGKRVDLEESWWEPQD